LIVGLVAFRVGLDVLDRWTKPKKKATRHKRKELPLWKELTRIILPGTALVLVFGAVGVRVHPWLVTIVVVGWGIVFLAFFLDARTQRKRLSQTTSLAQLNSLSPDEFEAFVADLFRRKGAKAQVIGGQGDHGVDIEVTGRDGTRALVQCKRFAPGRWVGEGTVRDLYGSLMADGQATKAYLVTTGFFSRAARDWAAGKPLNLMNGEKLIEAVQALEGGS
jgi:restriction system protein